MTGSSTAQEVNSVGSGRGVLWKYALTIIKQNPIFGVGVNNVYVAVHNAYLQIAMYTGIVGLILYILPLASRTITMIKSAGNLDAVQKISLFMAMSYIISAFFGLTVAACFPCNLLKLTVIVSLPSVLSIKGGVDSVLVLLQTVQV